MTDKNIINDEDLWVRDGIFEYKDKPFTGMAREYREDGSIVNETNYVNGVQEGVARAYHPSGQLYDETYWMRNGMHGPSREWSESGQLVRDALYEHGILVTDKKWDESGRVIEDYAITEANPLFETLLLRRRREREDLGR